MTVEFPKKFAFLFQPHRYKVAKGGRGGMKSWAFADALLLQGAKSKLRILCGRENMNSINESVHHLLASRARDLGLGHHYAVEKSRIMGKNGTEFIFAGLKHNVANIKSTEAVDIAWIEEAATVSKGSWETLIPTIRKAASEIWVSYNPELETDDTHKRFVLNSPPDCVVVHTTYLENKWLPEVLRIEAEYMRENDPSGYAHVWLGECKSAIEGAIYGEELKIAEAEGRITKVSLDRTKPVHTFWDLGFGDKTAIWFAQPIDGWYNVVDYLEDSGKTIEHYVIQLQNKGYMFGQDWLPHDAVDTIIHAKLGADKTRSIEQLMRNAGRNVRVAPKLRVVDGINATRTLFSQCRFDAEKCADGLQALRHYQWKPLQTDAETAQAGLKDHQKATGKEPLHNWASHGADAFRTLATGIRQPVMTRPVVEASPGGYSWMA